MPMVNHLRPALNDEGICPGQGNDRWIEKSYSSDQTSLPRIAHPCGRWAWLQKPLSSKYTTLALPCCAIKIRSARRRTILYSQ
jgi:hypothetical protein